MNLNYPKAPNINLNSPNKIECFKIAMLEDFSRFFKPWRELIHSFSLILFLWGEVLLERVLFNRLFVCFLPIDAAEQMNCNFHLNSHCQPFGAHYIFCLKILLLGFLFESCISLALSFLKIPVIHFLVTSIVWIALSFQWKTFITSIYHKNEKEEKICLMFQTDAQR